MRQPAPPSAARRPAVVLFSGGLDSTTTLAIAQAEGFDVHALTFRYGQAGMASALSWLLFLVILVVTSCSSTVRSSG